jgi:heme A synthase
MPRLRTFAWTVLGWNILTVLGGALVRATGSGAGCGRSWPTCQGTVVPRLQGSTAIEFTHRAVSGLALLGVLGLAVAVFRALPKGGRARRGVLLAVVAIIGEALIGALIVFSEWVADDASVARVIAVPLHLVNTLFLLAALTLTIVWLDPEQPRSRLADHRRWFVAGVVGMGLIAATGAVTALADTLFPKEGVSFVLPEAGEHFLTWLRMIHPLVATVVGLGQAIWVARQGWRSTAARVVMTGVAVQLGLGVVNILAGTPVWLSLLHLLAADVLWIAWIWLAAEPSTAPVAAPRSGPVPAR